MNLYLAVFWAILGAGMLGLPLILPAAPDLTIRGTGVSAGWLGVFLALYNLARWWLSRRMRRTSAAYEGLQRRNRLRRKVDDSRASPIIRDQGPEASP